jgi:hypothetical protein
VPVNNLPTILQPIVQQGFLEREFQDALRSRLGYRAIADQQDFSIGIGETLTKTRAGLKPAVTTPLAGASNTNLDNGLTPGNGGVEQYTITLNHYAATTVLNMVTSKVGIKSQFLLNAKINGEQAMRSLDDLARNALFNAYFGGNTRVRTTLGSAGPVISVDDVRGFQTVFVNGVQLAISNTNYIATTVGASVYNIGAVAVDGSNVSLTPGGISGTLTTVSGNILVADGTAGNAVTASTASSIMRPNARLTSAALTSSDGLTMANILDAVAQLRLNAVPEVDGLYNCYADPKSLRQLFSDADFKQLFQGVGGSDATFRNAAAVNTLGVRFVTTTEAYVQAHPTIAGAMVRRPIVCGADALIEGNFAGIADLDVAPADSIINVIDGVAMVTREPIDRLQQIIAQSWYWIGGFAAPSDTTTNATTVPTATSAAYKRAVIIEHIG